MVCDRHEDLCHRYGVRRAGRGRRLRRHGQRRHLLRLDAQKIDGLKRGVMPIYEPGLDKLVTHNAAEGRLTFTTDVDGRRRRRRGGPAGGRHAARPRRLGRSVVHPQGRRATSPSALTGWAVRGDQVDRPRRHRRQDRGHRQQDDEARVRGRLEPRVPQGRRRGQRLHEARSRGDRRPSDKRADRDAARALRAVHAHQRSHAGHGSPLGRADQVRRQLDAGDAHLVHERPRQPVRAAGRRHRARAQGDGLGQRASAPSSCSRARASAAAASPRTCAPPSAPAARSATSWRSSTPSSPSTSARSDASARRSSRTSAAT